MAIHYRVFQLQFNNQRDKMVYPFMSRLPGWGVYHEYQNLDVDNQAPHDVEADGELRRLLNPGQKRPKPW